MCASSQLGCGVDETLCVWVGCLECMLIANLIRCELTSGAAWTKLFGLPEIVMLKELHQRAPVLLKNTIMSVDVMADASEQVLSLHADGLPHCMLVASLNACWWPPSLHADGLPHCMQVLSVLYTCFSGGAIIHELGLGEAEVIAC